MGPFIIERIERRRRVYIESFNDQYRTSARGSSSIAASTRPDRQILLTMVDFFIHIRQFVETGGIHLTGTRRKYQSIRSGSYFFDG